MEDKKETSFDARTFADHQKKRKIKDFFAAGSTYLFSSFMIAALIAIIVFVVAKGYKNLSWDFITGDYHPEVFSIRTDDSIEKEDKVFTFRTHENEYFSSSWGLAFYQNKNKEGNPVTEISYIAPGAVTDWVNASDGKPVNLKAGSVISSLVLWTEENPDEAEVVVPDITDAKKVAEAFDKCSYLKTMTLQRGGLGIRGSLLTTLWMILITMALALPLGIGAAVYFAIYAKDSAFTRLIRSMIDMISGIPSVIFGLVGGLVFVPLFGGHVTILAGSMTLAAMILPLIIKTTEESISAIPHGIKDSSLALGASLTQTVFKVILPNALPGILSSALLGIGRVVGESAALIYTAGTSIQDYVLPNRGSASLAVHIWVLMSGENQNFEASCSIAIIILLVILVLNLLIKLLTYRLNRFQKGK